MSQYGHLIVFEGADSAGKTSLSSEAINFLRSNGFDCEGFSFPGKEKNTLGGLVYEIHHFPENFGLSELLPASLQALHIAAHMDTIEKWILPALRVGKSIVLDRFWWSTWVYGMHAHVGANSLELMINLEKLHWADVVPSVVFLVKRPILTGSADYDGEVESLNRLYDELAFQERKHYPVQVVTNKDLAHSIYEVTTAIKHLHKTEK